MISFTTLLLCSAVAAVIYYLFFKNDKSKNLPPGPFAYPLIGNLIQVTSGQHVVTAKWAREYGDVYQFNLGPKPFIVVSDPKLIREAFNDTNFLGKPAIDAVNLLTDGPRGLINSTGKEWEEQRRFTLRNLRDFGFGKSSLESAIREEINELLESFKSQEGQSLNLRRKFSLAALNSLWNILTSKRFNHDDPKLLDILLALSQFTEELTANPLLILPYVNKLAPGLTGWSRLEKLVTKIKGFIEEAVAEHKETLPEDGEPRDFMDVYINEMKAAKDPSSSFYGQLGEKNLLAVMSDLFQAGGETTSVTLNWTLLYLSKNPHVQRKVQEELDNVVGKNRQPSLSDRPNLPYCMATMEESLRYASLVPGGSIRTTLTDTKLNGYDIPKGSWVTGNFFYIHHHPKYFPEPEKFNPSRFLVDGGKTFKKGDYVFAFSVGRRSCLGESLARDSFFLFFTSIVQRFEIRLADKFKDMDIAPKPSAVLLPPEYEVVLKDRLVN